MNRNRYDDIINLPHHQSDIHPHMSVYDRAAQFSPFAALTGHEEAIRETARLTERETEMSEDQLARLDEKLQLVRKSIGTDTQVTITCFQPDERKSGGAYHTVSGVVKRIDEYEHTVVMMDRTVIPIDKIREIEEK